MPKLNIIITGTGAVDKEGSGRLVLTGASQFTGAFNLNNGIVTITNGAALGNPSNAVVINNPAALELQDVSGNGTAPVNLGLKPITIQSGIGVVDTANLTSGALGYGIIRSVAGNNTISGVITYTAGGVVYGLRRPDPSPRWFGFHEVFHALTVVAFGAHCVGLGLAVGAL